MKKIIALISSVLFCGILFTSFSPSLDGRAVVADDGTFPKGIFAKTVGYLPGDTISVTSLSTNKTVDIFVIGSIESTEGIAILLSPEAADELGLPRNANNVVKITKRSGQFDEAIAGTAVIGAASDMSNYNEDDFGDADPDEQLDDEYLADNEEREAEDVFGMNTKAPLEDDDYSSEEEYSPVKSEIVENEMARSSEYIPFEEDEEVSKEPEQVEVIAATDAEDTDETVSNEYKDEEVESVIELVQADDLDDDADEEVVSSTPFDEGEVVAEEDIESEKTEEKVSDELEVVAEAYIEDDDEYIEDNDEILEDVTSKEVISIAATTYESSTEESNEEETYEPIILVPAQANPPVVENTAKADTLAQNTVEVSEETKEEKNISENASPSVAETKMKSDEIDISNYTVSSLGELEKGKYYIQIAMLGNENNVRSTIKKYSKQYPVVLVPLSNGKGYQFLIGALSMDEYGTVLNRFKSYGYKDAFLRKIK